MRLKTKQEREAQAYWNSQNSQLLHGSEIPKAILTGVAVGIIGAIILSYIHSYIGMMFLILLLALGMLIGDTMSKVVNKRTHQLGLYAAFISVVCYIFFYYLSLYGFYFSLENLVGEIRWFMSDLISLLTIAAGSYAAYKAAS